MKANSHSARLARLISPGTAGEVLQPSPLRRILGVDPGLADTGWAILEESSDPHRPQLLSSGLIQTFPSEPLSQRLHSIFDRLTTLFITQRPALMALEEMFFMKAANSVRASLQARGVIILAASKSGIPIFEYNPRQIKSTLTGSGMAAKAQMQKMVQRCLGLENPLRPDDVADAAAIALCHFRAGRLKKLHVVDQIGGKTAAYSVRGSL